MKKPIPADPKTTAQLAQRQKYKDAVAAWHALSPEEKEAWRGVCPGLTAYQCFIRSELKYVPPPPPEEFTEEQTQHDSNFGMRTGWYTRCAQRMFIVNRKVIKLVFVLHKIGAPTGDITFLLRRVSDDGVIASKVWGDASDLTADDAWYEVELDTPVLVNEEVRQSVEFTGGDGSNLPVTRYMSSDVKASEYFTPWFDFYESHLTEDLAYRYKYYLP